MEPIAMMEFISVIYVCMSLVSQFLERDDSKSMQLLRICSELSLLWLLADAFSYVYYKPGDPEWLVFLLGLLSYTMSSGVLIGFMKYCEAFFSERITLNPLVFRIPTAILLINTAVIIAYYCSGNIMEWVDGYYVIVGNQPPVVLLVFAAAMMISPIIAFIKRKQTGYMVVVVFAAFGLPIIISLMVLIFTGKDLTVLMSVVSTVFITTILQHKSVKERLEASRVAAEEANKAKSDFLFSMSHDIRTPMNAILGYVDIALRHENDTSRVHDSLIKTKMSGDHLLNLINDILEMSRIESGKLELAENPVDIRKLVDGVSQMSENIAISKDVRFSSRIGRMVNPYVMTDELHVNEILINLISNSVKYNIEGGQVELITEQVGTVDKGTAYFRFIVWDNGIGMSEEFQKHLFEDFSREHTATVSKQEGAGLGLSIVKRIIDHAGGTIDVKSKKGEGSEFTVVLPMRLMDEAEEKKFREEEDKNPVLETDDALAGKKVLLVEDNDLNREIANEILEEIGLDIDDAEDGAVAVRMVSEKGADYYDFILMDIQMPVMDGYEATMAIRKLPNGGKVPIIALSANAFREDMEKSRSVGMNAHVAKPIDVKRLIAAMRGL